MTALSSLFLLVSILKKMPDKTKKKKQDKLLSHYLISSYSSQPQKCSFFVKVISDDSLLLFQSGYGPMLKGHWVLRKCLKRVSFSGRPKLEIWAIQIDCKANTGEQWRGWGRGGIKVRNRWFIDGSKYVIAWWMQLASSASLRSSRVRSDQRREEEEKAWRGRAG